MPRVLRAALLAAGLLPISQVDAADSKLLQAVMSRDQKAVAVLIKSGADVNAARADGSTPLAWAINREDPGVPELAPTNPQLVLTGRSSRIPPSARNRQQSVDVRSKRKR